jgi:hypothetical protein
VRLEMFFIWSRKGFTQVNPYNCSWTSKISVLLSIYHHQGSHPSQLLDERRRLAQAGTLLPGLASAYSPAWLVPTATGYGSWTSWQ